jgi:cytochrome o ubiquinol oxidase subunit 2
MDFWRVVFALKENNMDAHHRLRLKLEKMLNGTGARPKPASVMSPRTSALRSMCALAVPLALGGCGMAVLSPAGPVGAANRTILFDALAIMLAIVVPTIVAILAFAWWFRDSNTRARRLPTFSYSGRIELIVWSIPALVVFFLGGIAWIGSQLLDPARPLSSGSKPLEIQAVSLDWKWLFIYPDQGVASVNDLVAPAGVPLHFSITSASVFNVFFVPRLGSEIYSMYGMITQLNLQADRPGVYPGLSAHYSGDGFSDMAFDVHAVTAQDFSAWATAAGASGPALDQAAYRSLLKQSEHVTPYTYRAVEPALFDAIVMQKLPPGEGPEPAASPEN